MRTVVLSVYCLALLACDGVDPGPGVDSNALCDCVAQSAAETSYNNTGSGLAGTDVQDAVDELAARPTGPGEVLALIKRVQTTDTSPPGGGVYSAMARCPTVEGMSAKALGGACRYGGDYVEGVSIGRTYLHDAAFECTYNKPVDISLEVTATVTCLMPAE